MANKKISQLAGTLPKEIISGNYLFATAAGNAGVGYETKRVTAQEIAEYVFTGAEGGLGFPASQLSGTKNVYLNNSNWVNSTATQPPNYGFLMLRTSDGLLTTGSGIGTPVDGDNLGDHTATQALNMANNDIIGADDIRFYNSSQSVIAKGVGNDENLAIKGGNELILKGNNHILMSGKALDVATIPVSGNMTVSGGNLTITGGDLEIDPLNKIIVNQISGYAVGADNALLTLEGASTHVPFSNGSATVDWSNSNIQYKTRADGVSTNYDFTNVADGQTLTLYYQNTHGSTSITPKFRSGVFGPQSAGSVVWGEEYSHTPPPIEAKKTNIYTFVRINTGVFASAVTGYVY